MKNVLFKRSKHSLNTGLVNWTYKTGIKIKNKKSTKKKFNGLKGAKLVDSLKFFHITGVRFCAMFVHFYLIIELD